jgi:hypothetical protein
MGVPSGLLVVSFPFSFQFFRRIDEYEINWILDLGPRGLAWNVPRGVGWRASISAKKKKR